MTETRDYDRTASVQMDDGRSKGQVAPRMTAVQQARAAREQKKQAFVEAATLNQATIERSLKHHGLSFDFFMAALEVGLRNTMKNDEKFFEVVSPQSFLEAVLKATHFGLLPDGKEGAIVRFAEEAAFLPMVEGFIKILWKTGAVVEINHNVVCDGDDFDFQEGDDGYVTHRRSLRRAENAETIGAWCVVKLATGGKLIEVCDLVDLKKIAAVSRAQKGPRVDWSREMHRKAPFRRVVKRMPKSAELNALIAHDDSAYDLARTALPAPERPAIPPKAIFANKAAIRRAPPEQSRAEGEPEPDAPAEAQEEPRDESDVISVVTAMRNAKTLTELAEAENAAKELSPSAEESQWILESLATAKARLLPPGEPFKLTAVITSTQPPREYDAAAFWVGDILAKLSALSGDALRGFWQKNLSLVREASENGFTDEAIRVLDAAAAKGLPTE